MTRQREITIVIADDHPLVLRAVESLVESQPDLHVVAQCTDGVTALASVREHRPAIALLDVAMPGHSGLEVLVTLRAEGIATRIVFLTASIMDNEIYAALDAGVDGIVLKDSAPEVLLECLREVAIGGKWYPPELVQQAMEREERRRAEGSEIMAKLTAREREIFLLATRDLSNKEIANKLGISDGTVKLHMHSVYQKLSVYRRSDLTRIAERYRDILNDGDVSG